MILRLPLIKYGNSHFKKSLQEFLIKKPAGLIFILIDKAGSCFIKFFIHTRFYQYEYCIFLYGYKELPC